MSGVRWISGSKGIRTAMPVPPFRFWVSNSTVTSLPMLFEVHTGPLCGFGLTATVFWSALGMAPEEASTVFWRISLTEAPTAPALPPSRTAVLIDWTWRNASPNPMMPKMSMNSSGAINAISTADAPSSRPRRRLATEPLRVDRLESLVERDRIGRRPLLDRRVVDAGLVQLLARLQQQIEPHEIDAGRGCDRCDGGRRILPTPPEQAHRGS